MNKVFVLPASEDWIVDRFVKEWTEDNLDITTTNIIEADVIWILASWCWRQIPLKILATKKVIVTVHHVVPDKFDDKKKQDFIERDRFVTAYHVYNHVTHDFIRPLTSKPIHVLSYWANQKIWRRTGDKSTLKKKYGLPERPYLIGSFQRDTEGSDLKTPKLEKGPDLFVDFIKKTKHAWDFWSNGQGFPNPHVVLAGWRRQYVIERLKEIDVSFTYFELPDQETLNELYQTLDLYPVASRHEGGPQSLIECGLIGVPVISRDVGIASQVLTSTAIKDDIYFATPKVPVVDSWKLPSGYLPYRKLIESL